LDSPCISVCRIGEDDTCIGCGRTLEEIRGWKQSSDEEKSRILDRLSHSAPPA
jgi:predicted Fe-S protein YdhL (DUF1289 family)